MLLFFQRALPGKASFPMKEAVGNTGYKLLLTIMLVMVAVTFGPAGGKKFHL